MKKLSFIVLTLLLITPFHVNASNTTQPTTPLPAFPGAEGFGSTTPGGRGGRVYFVSNLNDSGAGSLRECIEASIPRICVFNVAGVISLNSNLEVRDPYITIAGQTAPGDGITIKAANPASDVHLRIRTHDVILRYVRLRPGTRATDGRALSIGNGTTTTNPAHNVVIDHVSMSWAGDEVLIAWYATHDVALQWNIISESLPGSENTGLKGPNLGATGGGNYSFHHNLVAHHSQRSPNISASGRPVDVINNLVYNFGGIGSRVHNGAMVNFIGNYIKAGPNTHADAYVKDDYASEPEVNPTTRGFYVADNLIQGATYNGQAITFLPAGSRSKNVPFNTVPMTRTPAQSVYEQVLNNAGAIHRLTCDGKLVLRRDAVDTRVIQSVRDGTRGHALPVNQTFEQKGYISSPEDVGGYPVLDPGAPCPDSDRDGTPDAWETLYFASPSGATANTDFDRDGYMNVEEYLNGTNPRQVDGTPVNPTSRLFLPLLTRSGPSSNLFR